VSEKPNPEIDQRIEENLISLRAAVRRTESIAQLVDHPGWMAIRDDLRERLLEIEEKLERFEKMTPEERVIVLKERKDFRLLVDLVDAAAERLPELYAALKEHERRYDERKHRNGTVRT